MRTLVLVYIIEEAAHALAQNAPLQWLSSNTGLGVVHRLLSEICWLRIWWSRSVILLSKFHTILMKTYIWILLIVIVSLECDQNIHSFMYKAIPIYLLVLRAQVDWITLTKHILKTCTFFSFFWSLTENFKNTFARKTPKVTFFFLESDRIFFPKKACKTSN